MRLAARAELPLVLLITPALLFPTPARLIVLAPLPFLWVAIKRETGEWVPATPANLAVFVLITMAIVSLALTPDMRFSLDKVAGVILGVLTFFALVRQLRTRRRLWLALFLFALAGAALALVGLAGTQWLDKFPAVAGVTDRLPPVIRGVRGAEEGFHPNAVAGALVLFLPLQAALLIVAARARRRDAGTSVDAAWLGYFWITAAAGVAFTVSAITLLLTQSRGGLAALGGAAVFTLFTGSRRQRHIAAVSTAAVVVAILVVGPGTLLSQLNAPINPRLGDLPGRIELWSRAVYAIADAPMGTGMNVFRRMKPHRYPTFPREPEGDFAHAHNQFLQTAVDLGIPGLIAFLALCQLIFVMVWRIRADPELRAIATALGTGVLAHLGFGLTDAIPLGAKVGITFWWAIAIIAAAHSLVRWPPADQPDSPDMTVSQMGAGRSRAATSGSR